MSQGWIEHGWSQPGRDHVLQDRKLLILGWRDFNSTVDLVLRVLLRSQWTAWTWCYHRHASQQGCCSHSFWFSQNTEHCVKAKKFNTGLIRQENIFPWVCFPSVFNMPFDNLQMGFHIVHFRLTCPTLGWSWMSQSYHFFFFLISSHENATGNYLSKVWALIYPVNSQACGLTWLYCASFALTFHTSSLSRGSGCISSTVLWRAGSI